MGSLNWQKLWLPLRSPRFWMFVGLLFAAKLLWYLLMGIHVEADSIGYLRLHAGLWHPPGYMAFTDLLLRLSGHRLGAVIVGQTALFAFSFNWLMFLWIQNRRFQWLVLLAISLDYGSSLYCISLLSECFYLSLTLLALVPLRLGVGNARPAGLAVLVGALIGLTYLTRFAALATLAAVILWWVWAHWGKWKSLGLGILGLVLGFQVSLLPLRFYYQNQFGTFQFNAFTAMSQWNNAAYLFPDSELASNPQNSFQKFLGEFPEETFDFEATLSTAHIHDPSFPLQRYYRLQHMNTREIMAFSDTLNRTALALVWERPFEHLQRFYLRNFLRPFTQTEFTRFSEAETHFELNYPGTRLAYATWYRELWWAYAVLLVLMTVSWWRQQAGARKEQALFILFCLVYLGAVWAGAVMFVRYTYLLAPFLLLGLAVRHGQEKSPPDLGE